MDFLLDSLVKLSDSLSAGESISLILILIGIIGLTIKYTITVINYVKSGGDNTIGNAEESQVEQLLLTLHALNEKLIKIENTANEDKEISKSLEYQLSLVNEKLQEMKDQAEHQHTLTRDVVMKTSTIINTIKQTLEVHAESTESRSAENRTLHHNTLELVNELSKDVAQLQGTLLGSLAGGRLAVK